MANPYDPIRQNLLYPLDNPDFAIRNAMSDVGVNPYTANPFAQAVGRLGKSSANTYLTQMAGDNTINDVNAQAIANQGAGGRGSAVAFSDYLRNTVSGGQFGGNSQGQYAAPTYQGRTEYGLDGSKGIQGNIGNAGFFFNPQQSGGPNGTPGNNVIQKIRQYRNDLNSGNVNFSNINPFLVTLSDQLGANGGLGTADFIADMYQPYLAPSMANAYRRALGASGEQAIRRLSNEPITSQNDIWTYLLGY